MEDNNEIIRLVRHPTCMKKKFFLIVSLFFLGAFWFCSLKANGDGNGGSFHGNSIVAIVDGIKITKNDIEDTGTQTTAFLIKELAFVIKKTINQETSQMLGVEVSEPEIQAKWEQITNNTSAPIDSGARVGIQGWLITEKLNTKIDGLIAQTDRDFAEYLRLSREPNPDIAKMNAIVARFEKKHNSTVVDYIAAERYLWWQARYKEIQIKILDPNLQPALALVHP
jgi:hypothetical protein